VRRGPAIRPQQAWFGGYLVAVVDLRSMHLTGDRDRGNPVFGSTLSQPLDDRYQIGEPGVDCRRRYLCDRFTVNRRAQFVDKNALERCCAKIDGENH
jgi:hypothetical protein